MLSLLFNLSKVTKDNWLFGAAKIFNLLSWSSNIWTFDNNQRRTQVAVLINDHTLNCNLDHEELSGKFSLISSFVRTAMNGIQVFERDLEDLAKSTRSPLPGANF